jgi:DNA invertase Pin-like site-specific DNA recombinase
LTAAIYARVSTTDQNCALQLDELREYAKRRGWDVGAEYVDTGWSGAKSSRPELDRMTADARAHKFDVLLVWKLDRYGRSVLHLVDGIAQLRAFGVRFIATTQGLDTDDSNPGAKLMLYILAAVAEFERSMLSERVKGGIEAYRRAMAAGQVGTTRHSRSGKNLQSGRPKAIFNREKALAMHAAGYSLRAIGKKHGVSRATVDRLIKAAA